MKNEGDCLGCLMRLPTLYMLWLVGGNASGLMPSPNSGSRLDRPSEIHRTIVFPTSFVFLTSKSLGTLQ